ncbi:MAG TPA: rhodanese-like domain-containing protein [Candidatus Limnocylindrales bacterium]|nr:rhodanese-like domain-containing protein [Candidatus Limnocylindrales bacterium]
MAIKRVEPDEAARLMNDGWTYLDVRSVPEFEQGHPAGAFNIPLLDMVPGQGLRPNPAFVVEVRNTFPPDARLVVGCKSGGRSAKAAQMLAESGYTNVVDMRGGFGGETDAGGQVTCAGWQARKLPTSSTAEPGRSYRELKK